MIPAGLQDVAAIVMVALAAAWLVVHWLRIGKPRVALGCSRCDRNPVTATQPSRGVRSARLRVID